MTLLHCFSLPDLEFCDFLFFLSQQVFHTQIVMMNREEHLFPNDVIPMMFSNVKSIYQFHHDFLLPQLEKRMQDW